MIFKHKVQREKCSLLSVKSFEDENPSADTRYEPMTLKLSAMMGRRLRNVSSKTVRFLFQKIIEQNSAG